MVKMSVGKRIRELRQAFGMTQAQLAERVHVSRSSVQSWENGMTYPSIDNSVALARLFHVSTDYLLAGSPHKTISLEPYSMQQRQIVYELLTHFEEHTQSERIRWTERKK